MYFLGPLYMVQRYFSEIIDITFIFCYIPKISIQVMMFCVEQTSPAMISYSGLQWTPLLIYFEHYFVSTKRLLKYCALTSINKLSLKGCWSWSSLHIILWRAHNTCENPRVQISWWRHQMETFSALLAFCAGDSSVLVNFPHKDQWRGALFFSLICARINDWVNNREVGDLRRHHCHYDVNVMIARL